MSKSCTLTITPVSGGYLFQVAGRGTMHESPSVRDFIGGAIDDGASVTLDLSECEYLDSTFLGCLVMLQRRGDPARQQFQVFADAAKQEALFSGCQLQKVISFASDLPAATGHSVELQAVNLQRMEFCGHLLETHRTLAKLEGSAAATFQRIADQIARDLEDSRSRN